MDSRCFKRIEHPADVRALPNYTDDVNPAKDRLSRVIQPYELREEMRCSLVTCHQSHKEGLIIELEDGRLSNIGHVCGVRPGNFGSVLKSDLARFSDERIRAELSPRLQARADLKKIFETVRDLRNECYVWALRLNTFLDRFSLRTELRSRHLRLDGHRVVEDIERSNSEITRLVDSGAFPTWAAARYSQIERGKIRGLDAAHSPVPFDAIYDRADALCQVDPLTAKTRELIHFAGDLNALPSDIASIQTWLVSIQVFLSPQNLAVLAYVAAPRHREEIQNVSIDDLDSPQLSSSTRERGPVIVSQSTMGKRAMRHQRKAAAQARAANYLFVRDRDK